MIIELYKEYYSVDSTKYLIVMFLIDYLVANEDRHTNNFGILVTQSGGIARIKFLPIILI